MLIALLLMMLTSVDAPLAALGAAPADLPQPASAEERTRFAPAEITLSYTVDRSGGIIDCAASHVGTIYDADELSCDDMRDQDVLAAMLGRPLAGLSEVDVRFAFTPLTPGAEASHPRAGGRILSAARLTVAPSGDVSSCTVTAAAKFAGFSLDLCDMLKTAGTNRFEIDRSGTALRRGEVILEAIGFGG